MYSKRSRSRYNPLPTWIPAQRHSLQRLLRFSRHAGRFQDRTHPRSPHLSIAALIKAGLPVFKANPADLSVPEGAVGPRPAASAEIPPPAGVVRMNPYVMLEQKPLTEESARSDIGIADYAMDTYIGGIDELDRGFLNAYTLPELWAKIPILGALPFAGAPGTVTNQERAMRLYRLEQKAEILKEQQDFDAIGKLEAEALAL